jgi:diguanylate cyclase (GGDEF)-like protein
MIKVVIGYRPSQGLVSRARTLREPLRALPPRARWWWAATLLVSAVLAPRCLSQVEPGLPLVALLVAPLLNGALVLATAPRRQQTALTPSFDYGGIATVALLGSFGPAPALCAFAGEKIAAAFVPDRSGQRPAWIKSAYNFAWGAPCIIFSWAVGSLAPDRTLEPAFVAAAWWLCNGVLVGTMATLARRRTTLDDVRRGVTQEGWLRLQEGILSVLAVVVWWTNPPLLLVVVLLVIGQATTGRRLFREHEGAAAARALALAERQRAEVEAAQARHDPLTRLPNRRSFEEILDSKSPPAAVLMLDLDHFKRINDTFGHDVGDRVLVEMAAVLRETLGNSAFCARLGGEEFCVLVSDVASDDELLFFAERIRRAVKELRFGEHEEARVTVSIGAARREPHEATARDAIVRADQALYSAKRNGRDQTHLDDRANPRRLAS